MGRNGRYFYDALLDNEDKCGILVEHDISGNIEVIGFVNPSKDDNCGLKW